MGFLETRDGPGMLPYADPYESPYEDEEEEEEEEEKYPNLF